MFLRVVLSLLLITVLSAEGPVFPPDICSYIDWACGLSLSGIERVKTADADTIGSGILSASFSKVNCSAKIKRLSVFTPICNKDKSRLPEFDAFVCSTFSYTDFIETEEPFLYISDNSPPFSFNSAC